VTFGQHLAGNGDPILMDGHAMDLGTATTRPSPMIRANFSLASRSLFDFHTPRPAVHASTVKSSRVNPPLTACRAGIGLMMAV
jgi:hypothetical protein